MREGTSISGGLLVRSDNELTRAEKIANLLAQADPAARSGMIQSYRDNPYISAELLAEGLQLAQSLGVTQPEKQVATQAQITELYRTLLGREPDQGGLQFYSNPDFSLELIRNDIANSAEAKAYAQAQEAAQRQAEIDAREAAATAGAGVGAPAGVTTTSNLLPSDIAWLSQGKGMFGNPLYGDPTSPLSWAAQFGAFVPGTDFLVSAASNALGLTEASMIAQDAKSLANAGLSEDQIISTLQASGVRPGAAVTAAGDAVAGTSVFDIAQNISGTQYAGGTIAPSSLPSTPASTGVPTGVTETPVQVTGTGGLLTTPATSGAVATSLLGATQPAETGQVQVTGQPSTTGLLGSTGAVTSAATGTEGTQTVNLQAKRQADVANLYQTILGRVPDAAGLAFYSNPDFTLDQIEADLRNSAEAKNRVNVTGSTMAGTGGTGGVTGATTSGTGATQTVPVESRTVPKETSSVLTPVSTGVVTTPRGEVPITTYNVPTTQTTITANPSISLLDAAAMTALIGGIGGLLNQGGDTTTPTVSQDYINSIINAPRPTYGTTPFVPGVMPGVTPMAPTSVYAPFGGSMGYGAGRFGATPQPFAFPGLLGMGRPATPSGASLL